MQRNEQPERELLVARKSKQEELQETRLLPANSRKRRSVSAAATSHGRPATTDRHRCSSPRARCSPLGPGTAPGSSDHSSLSLPSFPRSQNRQQLKLTTYVRDHRESERERECGCVCVCVHASRYMQVSRGRQALQVWRTQNLQESNKHKFRRCVRARIRIERGKVYKKTHTQPGLGRAGIGCTPGLHAEPKPYQTAMSTKSNQMRDLIKTSVL